MGDSNGHHQEWLGAMTTNLHGVASTLTTRVSGCDQLVVGPTQARGGTIANNCGISLLEIRDKNFEFNNLS